MGRIKGGRRESWRAGERESGVVIAQRRVRGRCGRARGGLGARAWPYRAPRQPHCCTAALTGAPGGRDPGVRSAGGASVG